LDWEAGIYPGFHIDEQDKAFRVNDALAVLEKAWTGETFSHKGEYFQFFDVKLEMLPKQKEVPTWIGTLSPRGAEFVAKVGYSIYGRSLCGEQVYFRVERNN
jgi:alkanesulfonate monooxygenase SsuD/methylene tetrahydromethanopterin reductase-like flavin-dependent oxidoreductase (luciferase family)